jgi:hypothetical protein
MCKARFTEGTHWWATIRVEAGIGVAQDAISYQLSASRRATAPEAAETTNDIRRLKQLEGRDWAAEGSWSSND